MAGYEKGLDNVIASLRMMADKERSKLLEAGSIIGATLLITARENAGMTDHSQEDLDKKDNPYSTSHGKDSGPHPDYQVHIQTGLLYESIEQDIIVTPDRVMISVGVSEDEVPYISSLVEGTSKMRPRDFLTETLHQEKKNLGVIIGGVVGPGGG